jgi:hypothetical protein
MPPTKDTVIQTAVSAQLAAALKAHAALRQVLLFDVFVEAMERFVAFSKDMHQRRSFIPYFVSPRAAKDFNVRIPEKLARRLQAIADEDGVALRRLVYTALLHYAVNERLIPPAGTVQSGVPAPFEDPEVVELLREWRKRRRDSSA